MHRVWRRRLRCDITLAHQCAYALNGTPHLQCPQCFLFSQLDLQVELLKTKIQKEEEAHCTFAPKISEFQKTADVATTKEERPDTQDFMERMKKDAAERESRRKEAQTKQVNYRDQV